MLLLNTRLLSGVFICAFLSILSFSANASHFRGGSISWQAVELDSDELKNDATITVVTAWALNGDNTPSIGLTPSVSVATVSASVVNIGTDYTLRTDVFQVQDLDLNTKYLISYGSCCRIGALVNNSNGNWDIQAEIFLKDNNLAPKIDLPILFDVPQLQSDGSTPLADYTFKVNTADPNADSLRYRLANTAEMGGGSNPTGFAINANTGIVTWTGSGGLASGLYSAGIIVEDLDSTGAIKSKSGADFILGLQNLAGVQYSTFGGTIPASKTIVVNKGSIFSFGVSSGTSTITSASLGDVNGALTEPTDNNYVFTPGASGTGLDPGTYPVTIEIVDSGGATTNSYLALTFIVANPNAPSIANIEGDTVIYSTTSAILIDESVDAVLTDADSSNLNGGSLKLQVIFEDSEWEVLGVTSVGDGAGEIRVSGSDVFYEGSKIGEINSIENGAGVALQIEFTSTDATIAAVQALIRSLNYTDTFLLRDVSVRGLTLAVTDGDANSNSYRLDVDVQGHPSAPATGSPLQASNRITLRDLGTVPITSSQLRYVDPDGTPPAGITLTASSITNGQFELITGPGTPITSFTQKQVDDGQVQFVHLTTNTLPTYSISADDGSDAATTPAAATIFYSVTSTDTASVAENQTVATTVTSATVTTPIDFSIVSGDDRTLFNIHPTTGVLSFVSTPDAEAAIDADANNIYVVDVRITDGQVNDIQTLSVTVTDVNDNVVAIISDGGGATASVSVNENTSTATTIVATDDISSSVVYSITGGVDQGDFNIDANTGVLSFASLPDFSAPDDDDGNNTYIVEVTADVSGVQDTQTLTIIVAQDVAPVFTSSATFSVRDGDTAVGTVVATDPVDSLTYSITGGNDSGDLFITAAGVLSFNSAVDINNPTDSDTNNSYLIEVTVTDGTTPVVQNITVSVTAIADADGDSVPDVFESPTTDSDGDGTVDSLDTDSDDDGVPDSTEIGASGTDTDGDGIDDAFDVDQTGGTDANADGFDDNPVFTDADADGIPDFLDKDDAAGNILGGDSDGDGIADQIECPTYACVDTDNDGIPNYADTDSDNDGIPDVYEGEATNTDGTGASNYLDTDSDDDGVLDSAESGVTVTGTDTDSDGIDDAFDVDQTGGTDANGDGYDDAPGFTDADSDGIPDFLDNADVSGNTSGGDSDSDGIVDSLECPSYPCVDSDGDGIPNYADTDSDGDGVPDAVESPSSSTTDSDSDGTPDSIDTDSDGDGIDDSVEIGVAPTGTDTDSDGIDDAFDVDQTGGMDTNGDGYDDNPGFTDTDSDGIPDFLDKDDGKTSADALGGDSDGDGVPDSVECSSYPCADTDGDGTPDYADADTAIVSSDLASVDTGLKGVGSFNPLVLLSILLLKLVRNFKYTVLAVSTFSLASVPLLVSADDSKKALSWYVGTGVGLSKMTPDTSNSIFTVDDETDTGYKFFAGLEVKKDWFLELGYNDLGTAKMVTFGEIDYQLIGLAGRYNFFDYSLNDESLIFYAKAGAAMMDNEANIPFDNVNSTQFFYGVGVEYPLVDDLVVRAELETYDEDASFVTLNIVKYFGRKSAVVKEKSEENEPVKQEEVEKEEPIKEVIAVAAVLDSDSDGVEDSLDQCSNTIKGAGVNKVGCAIFETKIEGVNFKLGSSELTDSSKKVLNQAVDALLKFPAVSIEIQAHTDSVGLKEKNQQLSEVRAKSVYDYLKSKGINGDRMESKGYGEVQPLVSNKTSEGRAKNRRVEFRVNETVNDN